MELDKKDIDLIDSYLKGELSEMETAEFNNRMASDIDFMQSVQFMQTTKASLGITTLQDKLKMLQNEENQNTAPIKKPESKNKLKIWLLLGVLAMVSVGVYLLVKSKNQAQEVYVLNDDQLQNSLIHKTMRSTDSDNILSTEQRIAYDLFAIHEFEEAIPGLQQLWERNRDTLAYFYLGVSYLAIGEKQKSSEILSDTFLTNKPVYKEKIDALLNQ